MLFLSYVNVPRNIIGGVVSPTLYVFADGVFFYAEWVGSRGNGTVHEAGSVLLSSEIAFIAPMFVFELTVHPQPDSAQSIFPISIFQTAVHVCFHHDTLSWKLNVSSEVEGGGKRAKRKKGLLIGAK